MLLFSDICSSGGATIWTTRRNVHSREYRKFRDEAQHAGARHRGAKDALIETLSERTAELYRHFGCVTVIEIPDYIGSFTKHVLVKALDSNE
jgi:hypothetical protein